jgi:hypothetical protein
MDLDICEQVLTIRLLMFFSLSNRTILDFDSKNVKITSRLAFVYYFYGQGKDIRWNHAICPQLKCLSQIRMISISLLACQKGELQTKGRGKREVEVLKGRG